MRAVLEVSTRAALDRRARGLRLGYGTALLGMAGLGYWQFVLPGATLDKPLDAAIYTAGWLLFFAGWLAVRQAWRVFEVAPRSYLAVDNVRGLEVGMGVAIGSNSPITIWKIEVDG